MKLNTLTKDKAIELFNNYLTIGEIPENAIEDLDLEYKNLRDDLLKLESESADKESYVRDLKFALKLYTLLNSFPWFNETVAGNYGFWRYVCLKVCPDIIYRRCGLVASYFYEKTTRMYIPKLWWYIHMSFQGDLEKTEKALKSFNTDYIMQLVERTGRNGFYLEITREIIKIISSLPVSTIRKQVCGANLFRRVLIQNTAKIENYNLVAENEVSKYVKDLFRSCKVEV